MHPLVRFVTDNVRPKAATCSLLITQRNASHAGSRRVGVFSLSAGVLALLLLLPLLHDRSPRQTTGNRVPVVSYTPAPASIAAPVEKNGNWIAEAHKRIAEKEYETTRNAAGLQAPNRANNIRTYFDKKGIRVHDRTAEGSPELFRLSLASIGRNDCQDDSLEQDDPKNAKESCAGHGTAEVGEGAVVAQGNRVEIQRSGITEWYMNKPQGLEQGFDIRKRPEGNGELRLALALDNATAALENGKIILTTATGRKLEYKDIKVVDAHNKPIPSRFQLEIKNAKHETVVVIAINDSAATYPVYIDPLLTLTHDALLESDQAGANFGWSVSGAGDVNGDGYADVIVGAPSYDNGETDEGAAFVYYGGTSGISAASFVRLESNLAGANFGWSVSGAGDVNGDGYSDVIVGALSYDNGEIDEGAAFVYHGSASGVSATAATLLESNQAGANFGWSVSGAGDVNGDGYSDVIVGAPSYDSGETDEGAAFVYHGGLSGISTAASALLESNQAGAKFGSSVSGAGDVNADGYADVIVGAPSYDNGQADEGAAFVYHGGPSGISTTAPSVLESFRLSANFGCSVSGAGDVNGDGYADVIVGASTYHNDGQGNTGAAFVYHGSASGVSSTAAALLEITYLATSNFGSRVSGAGDVNGDGYADVIVGASYHVNGGAAFIYHGSASGVSTTDTIRVEANQTSAFLGCSVSGAGDVNGDGFADVIVGANGYDNGETDEGTAFVYHGSAAGIPASTGVVNTAAAKLELSQSQFNASFGYSVSGAGDVNGDGYADVIVGAPKYDNGQADAGAAFLYHGLASGVSTTAATMLESNQAGAGFGVSVSGAGDVNGDGFADVIVGEVNYDNGQADEGAAFVYHGSVSGVSTTAAAILESNQAGAGFGVSVSGAGDVNGDGYADVIVGAHAYSNGQIYEGAAYVYHGSASGISTTAAAQLESNQAGAQFGVSVSGGGDVNGDGYADVIVGASFSDNGETDGGSAFVYHGGPSGIATTASTTLKSNQTSASFGWSVSSAGDVNGDGYADVIVGAPNYDNGQTDEGAAFVYHGAASGVSATPSAVLKYEYSSAFAHFGNSVSSAGDVNGDGYADVIVSAPDLTLAFSYEGAVFVYHGSASGVSTTAAARIESDTVDRTSGGFGNSVSGVGDVNGDGYADVIVGVVNYDESSNGAAFVYLGNTSGRPIIARQMRGNGNTTPVQPWGESFDP